MIIQRLWSSGLEWDDTVNGELLADWLDYRGNLNHIKQARVPRWLHCSSNDNIELHVFADASQKAYGAVVYTRVVDGDNVHVNIISAKTKVAPIAKQLSIPRLELCGAALAAKLISEISQVMNIPKANLHAWTDSTIVLAWLKGGPSRWSTFVSNRVSDILTILDYDQWGHVATDLNPANCASRGLQAPDLIEHSLWWRGPPWLSEPYLCVSVPDIDVTQEEKKLTSLTTSLTTEDGLVWTKFSDLERMLRIISYCRRFLNLKISKEKCPRHTKLVSKKEIENNLEMCIN